MGDMMDEKIIELENQIIDNEEKIKELENRLYAIERREASRKVGKSIKLLLTFITILAIAYGGIKAYNYITNELPQVVNNNIKDIEDKIKKNES